MQENTLAPSRTTLDQQLAMLVVLLYKFSSYSSETVSLGLHRTDAQQPPVPVDFVISDNSTFDKVVTDVKNRVNGEFLQSEEMVIDWKTELDEKGEYQIGFSFSEGEIKTEFRCKKEALLAGPFSKSADYLQKILLSVSADASLPVKQIEFLSANDIADINCISWGEYDAEIAKPALLHHLFEQSAERFPEHVAIHHNGKDLLYAELNNRANRLAAYFIQKGVQPGDFIGIHLTRSADVYLSILGILKAGAAYVPIDSGYPEDRVNYILSDAGVKFLISQSSLKDYHVNFKTGEILYTDEQFQTVVNAAEKPGNPGFDVPFTSPAYIIYTSGSTGRPKGVLIPHASASNLVKAEQKIFGADANHRIAQGFSVAFDASVEEIWLALASGSALFPVSEEVMHSGLELEDFIQKHQISVLSTVPTMLSMMSAALPSLKLLILGGEYCPHELLEKWHRDDLRITNTYGPTEATVIASCAFFDPAEKITIGRPITNYGIFITNPSQQLLPPGIPGELCIAGKSLATGYLNREELTAEKFITPEFTIPDHFPQRIYRSGDLARYNAKGQIEFLGRIDSQVKLRGYRIELSEIESQLLQFDNVKNAVAAVKEDEFKVQRLVAYVLLKNKELGFNENQCKDFLKTKLAIYMVPAQFMVLDSFPVLPSGKVDRKKLPDVVIEREPSNRPVVAPSTPSQEALYTVWAKYFPGREISVTDDFFDLGGHSLLASLTVSDLRKITGFGQISVQDIYTFRNIEKLAEHLDQQTAIHQHTVKKEKTKPVTVSRSKFAAVMALQSASFFVFMLVGATGLMSPFVIERIQPDISPYLLISLSSVCAMSTFPALLVVSILMKWLIIGKFRAGRYPLWGFYYFRFWLVKKFVDLTPLSLLAGTPYLTVYFRLMGVKIGKNVYLGSDRIRMFDLTEIGDNSSISREATLTGYTVQNGELVIGPVSIGKNCFVGTRGVLSEYTQMKDGSTLAELSLLPEGQTIPENENHEGSPARKTGKSKLDKFRSEPLKGLPYAVYMALQFLAILAVMLIPLVLTIPFGVLFYEIHLNYNFLTTLLMTIPFSALYILVFCVGIAGLKWLIIGKIQESNFSIYSIRYIQKWMVDTILQFVLLQFRAIYATIYLPSWLRLMGAKVGRYAEISTVNQISTDLLEIKEGSFLADSVSIGSPVVRNGIMYLRKTEIGSKTFIGNSSILSCGDVIGNDSLIGVLSVPSVNVTPEQVNGSSWLGSPSVYLPKRQASEVFDEKYTFHPTRSLILKRGLIEFFKITLPPALSICVLASFYKLIYDILLIEKFGMVLLISPFLLFGLILITPFITVLFKKILIGKYKPSNKPLWSVFVWKNELVNSLCESMVYPLLVNMFLGTPYAPWFFRMMGSKIGKRVFMETTEITEFDLAHIESNVSLNHLSTIQTHLFEDRVMKMSDLYIKKDCSVGAMAVVLYDSVMDEGSSIDALTLVMKGETIPANTRWAGSPAKFVS